jgi:hypothetical protein
MLRSRLAWQRRCMTANRLARAGSEVDGLTGANGSVLVAPWEDAAEEHGGDVFWVMGVDRDECMRLAHTKSCFWCIHLV